MKTMSVAMPQMSKMKVKVKSDHYFNHPEEMADMKEYSDCTPVDVFGSLVPEGKSLSNLKKTQENICERFQMEGGEY